MAGHASVIQGFFPHALPRGTGAALPNAIQLPQRTTFPAHGGQPLPSQVLQQMESFFRTSLSDVRVHLDGAAASIGALAFTHGSQIHFAPGRYNPATQRGLELLGHELAHVVQQRSGRVRNPFGVGTAIVQDRALEAEADRAGRLAAERFAGDRRQAAGTARRQPTIVNRTVQRCVHCTNTRCVRGELCGADFTYGGLFAAGDRATVVPYNQARYFPSGGASEFEHPIAGAALRRSGTPHNYAHEFTIQTPTVTHRAAQSGAGGGITSTGSSTTAVAWSRVMGATLAADPVAAVRTAAVEQLNAHWMAGTMNQMAVNGIVQWLDGQVTTGRINAAARDDIRAHIISTYWTRATPPPPWPPVAAAAAAAPPPPVVTTTAAAAAASASPTPPPPTLTVAPLSTATATGATSMQMKPARAVQRPSALDALRCKQAVSSAKVPISRFWMKPTRA